MKRYEKPAATVVAVGSEERVATCPSLPDGVVPVPGLDGYGCKYDSPSHGVGGCQGTIYYLNASFS